MEDKMLKFERLLNEKISKFEQEIITFDSQLEKLQSYIDVELPKYYSDIEFIKDENALNNLQRICLEADYYFDNSKGYWTRLLGDFLWRKDPSWLMEAINGSDDNLGLRDKVYQKIKEINYLKKIRIDLINLYQKIFTAYNGLKNNIPITDSNLFKHLTRLVDVLVMDGMLSQEDSLLIVTNLTELNLNALKKREERIEKEIRRKNKKQAIESITEAKTDESLVEEKDDINITLEEDQNKQNIKKFDQDNETNISLINQTRAQISVAREKLTSAEKTLIASIKQTLKDASDASVNHCAPTYLITPEGLTELTEILGYYGLNITPEFFIDLLYLDELDAALELYYDSTIIEDKKACLDEALQIIKYIKIVQKEEDQNKQNIKNGIMFLTNDQEETHAGKWIQEDGYDYTGEDGEKINEEIGKFLTITPEEFHHTTEAVQKSNFDGITTNEIRRTRQGDLRVVSMNLFSLVPELHAYTDNRNYYLILKIGKKAGEKTLYEEFHNEKIKNEMRSFRKKILDFINQVINEYATEDDQKLKITKFINDLCGSTIDTFYKDLRSIRTLKDVVEARKYE